jgi:hypothetical protein
LPKIIKYSKLKQFVDDNAFFKFIFNVNDSYLLQQDLNDINDWSSKNNLTLNPSKTVHIRISLKKAHRLPKYNLNNEEIQTNETYKYLGLIIDSSLNFNCQ